MESAIKKMDNVLEKWLARHLTMLRKILIAITFAVLQIIFITQLFDFSPVHFKKVNNILYKFIWNRNYLAAKAPERIKREYTNPPIQFGGLGLLDLTNLDKGLKLKAFATIFDNQHPFLKLIRSKLDLSDFFHPKCLHKINGASIEGIKILKEARLNLLDCDNLTCNHKYVAAIKEIKLVNVISEAGKNSLAFLI